MKIKRLLVVPCDTLVQGKEVARRTSFFGEAASFLAIKLGRSGFSYDGEIQFYGDFPALLGKEHVFVYGRFHPHLYVKHVPKNCPYPSCHGLPKGTAIGSKDLSAVMSQVDAVFVSLRGGERAQEVLAEAGRRGIPRALFDFEDYPEIYGRALAAKELTAGYAHGKDFELYFKKELPLGFRTDTILPLAPSPVRPESYRFPNANKRHAIFYSGRSRPGCQADREEAVALLGKFPGGEFIDHDRRRRSFLTTHEYWRHLAESRMALSPSGKSWDSYRHCEVGLAPQTLLIAPKPFIETAGPQLIDGRNAILYDTEFRDGKYHLKDAGALADAVRYYLSHDDERKKIADAWQRDVLSGHTVLGRSCYILESMERAFS